MTQEAEGKKVFISYAHKDEALRKHLDTHLSLMQRQGLIQTWHDRQIRAGMDWAEAIDTQLEEASIILLLVSADFVASDYCYGIEMTRALERHQTKQARVIPILVRPVDWTTAPFARLQALPTNGKAITSWKNRDEAFADVAAGLRKAIEEAPTYQRSFSPTNFPPIWNVPYPRNPHFTGREELLAQLATSLHAGHPTAISQPPKKDSQPQAISGLGGIGKTQVALEYAYRHHGEYQAILWVQAETKEALTSSYLELATLLDLPEKNAQESAQVIVAMKRWLQQSTGYLLILDNADDLALAREYLPPSMNGHVLLTTRAQSTGRFAQRIEVDILPIEQGVEFLLRRANVGSIETPLEQATEQDRALAREICKELGELPLALDQAGAYIEETGCGLAIYAKRYQQQGSKLLAQRRGELVNDHPLPVATTWKLSFERVEHRSPAGADLLRVCAFLAPDAIPESIITQGASHLGPHLAILETDETVLDEAREALLAYSLVKRDAANQTLSIHRLVQAVLKDPMKEKQQRQWAKRTISALSDAFPHVEHQNWPQCEQLLPHALACAQLIAEKHLAFAEAGNLLNVTGWYLKERARYQEAEPLIQQGLAIRQQCLPPDDHGIANSLSTLGYLYNAQGRLAEAEPAYKQALEIDEQALGSEHTEVATDLNNLAMLYQDQGKYTEAEPLCQRALAIREEQSGAMHPNTATSLNNLASLYRAQGKYVEAEPLYERALAIQEEQLGAMHPATATSLNNLAALYRAQGKYVEAEPLYERALAIYEEQQLGEMHPATATSLNNLASLYHSQGKYTEVEPLLERALAIREQQLGEMHPATATSLNNLASLYRAQGKYAEAEPLYQQALLIRQQTLGLEHPDTANSQWWFATLKEQQGKYLEAKELYEQAMRVYEQVLGTEHPTTQTIQGNYAILLKEIGQG